MHNIHIQGSITVSDNLFNKLRTLGLVTVNNEPSEDFFLFIQESLARESSHITTMVQDITKSEPAVKPPERVSVKDDTQSESVRSDFARAEALARVRRLCENK